MRNLRWASVSAMMAGLVLVTLSGCPKVADPWPQQSGPRVLASFAPVYCFALNVAGSDAAILPLMTSHGPHGYSDSPSDTVKLRRAQLFLINGLDLDNTIAKRVTKSSPNRNLRLVAVGDAIPASQLLAGGCNCEHDGDDDKHSHDHGIDPHVWLGIPEAICMVEKIRDEFMLIDPTNAPAYRTRAATYVERLQKLHAEGRELLKNKKERKLVTFHDSLQYFRRSFELQIAGVVEIAPGSEPGPKRLSELVKLCQDEKVRLIAVEPQYPSNTAAKTILLELRKKGIDAQFVEIDPLETARHEDLNADFYERKMRENLTNLAEKLQ